MLNDPDNIHADVKTRVIHEARAQTGPSRSRRRLVTGMTGGVLLAVQAKTALGNTVCQSPSAMVSGNASPNPNPPPCSGGRSPGFWKVPQKFNYWDDIAVPPTFRPEAGVSICSAGMQGLALSDIVTQGSPVSLALPSASPTGPSVTSPEGFWGMWAVLAFPTEFNGGQLMRHLIAAWLNANYFSDYPITTQQISEMWAETSDGGTYMGMTAQDVIDYISNMYDINAEVGEDPDLCKNSKKK